MNSRYRLPRREEDNTRINHLIRVPQVRLIDQEGEALGVKPTREALMLAEQAGLDLVEIAASADPPVCRIMDYGKFKYEKSKKTKEARKKQHVVHLKEVKFRPKTGDHDYQYKMQHARGFLVDSDRVKATVVFRGREITHIEFGEQLLQRLTLDLADLAQVELGARREGRNLISVYVPDKDKVIKFVRAQELAKKRQVALDAAQAASAQPAAQPAAAEQPQPAAKPQA